MLIEFNYKQKINLPVLEKLHIDVHLEPSDLTCSKQASKDMFKSYGDTVRHIRSKQLEMESEPDYLHNIAKMIKIPTINYNDSNYILEELAKSIDGKDLDLVEFWKAKIWSDVNKLGDYTSTIELFLLPGKHPIKKVAELVKVPSSKTELGLFLKYYLSMLHKDTAASKLVVDGQRVEQEDISLKALASLILYKFPIELMEILEGVKDILDLVEQINLELEHCSNHN